MSQAINTNVRSLMAQQALTVNGRNLDKVMQQLSTGQRINSAADDAAGLAVSQVMTAQIKGLDMAVRNANDAISMLTTAEGALDAVSNMVQRMRELAVQAANGVYSSTQLGYMDDEYQALGAEIDRVLANTTWNSMAVFGGSIGTSGSVVFQVGAGSSSLDTISISLTSVGTFSSIAGGSIGSIGASSAATTAIGVLDDAVDGIAQLRSTLGATINRLNYAADNAVNISTNTKASRSSILDTDYAAATTELARSQIIQQAATAMLAQGNQLPQTVLALLK
jgi:flagellin